VYARRGGGIIFNSNICWFYRRRRRRCRRRRRSRRRGRIVYNIVYSRSSSPPVNPPRRKTPRTVATGLAFEIYDPFSPLSRGPLLKKINIIYIYTYIIHAHTARVYIYKISGHAISRTSVYIYI